MCKQICATCKWRTEEESTGAMICTNGASDYGADLAEDDHNCIEWEGSTGNADS